MPESKPYILIHVTSGGEFSKPLVASQLFDQAYAQYQSTDPEAPVLTEVWIIEPLKNLRADKVKKQIESLKSRCPGMKIRVLPSISRFGDPVFKLYLRLYQWILGKSEVIFHCRGIAAFNKLQPFKQHNHKLLVDVRGHWPAEYLYNHNIHDLNSATAELKGVYDQLLNQLSDALNKCDGVATVSPVLKEELDKIAGRNIEASIVPCCVSKVQYDNERIKLRRELGYEENDMVIVYSGTTASYQHIEDYVLPFVNSVMVKDVRIKFLVLTPEVSNFQKLLLKYPAMKSVVCISVPQDKVGEYLTAADVGVLLRKPTLVNRVAQPVKVAEYLSSGLSLIVNDHLGGLSESDTIKNILYSINGSELMQESTVVPVMEWLKLRSNETRNLARKYVEEHMLWKQAIKKHQKYYLTLI